MTAAQQQEAFWKYVNSNEYLRSRKGEYAERYGEIQPWMHRFDAKILQDIFTNFGTEPQVHPSGQYRLPECRAI